MATKKNGYYDNYGNWVDTSQGQHQRTFQDNYGNDVSTTAYNQQQNNAQQRQLRQQGNAAVTNNPTAANAGQSNANNYAPFAYWSIAGGDPMSVGTQGGVGGGNVPAPKTPTPDPDKTDEPTNYPPYTGSGSGNGTPAAQEQRNVLGRSDVAVGTPGQFQGTGLYDQYAARGVIGNYDPATDAAYVEALNALRNAEANMPGYSNPYGDDLTGIYQKIVGREPFSYDLDADMLYQQYRQQYQQLGRNAMQDTMGQAAALTGGYGSTYSQGAGQQAYNSYLQQLNDRIPELEERAYQRWLGEGDRLKEQYAMARDMSDDAYAQYRDQMSDWLNNRAYAANQLDAVYGRGVDSWNREATLNSEQANRDYQQWASGYQINNDAWDRAVQQYQLDQQANNTAYSRQQDEQAKLLQLMQIGYQPTEDDLRAAGMTTGEYDAWNDYIARQQAGSGVGSPKKEEDSDLGEPTLQEYYDELSDMRAAGEIDKDTMYALYQQYAIQQQKKNGTTPKTSNFALWSAAGGGM